MLFYKPKGLPPKDRGTLPQAFATSYPLSMRLLLVLALTAAPFPSWGQVGRVTLEVSAAPTPVLGTSAAPALAVPQLSAASLTPGLGLIPTLAAPAANPLLAPVAGLEVLADQPALEAAVPLKPVAKVLPGGAVVKPAANDDRSGPVAVKTLEQAGAAAKTAPQSVGALFDGVPVKPDFDALATVKAPAAPLAWTPSFPLLKPAAKLVNAFNAASHDRRLRALRPGERVTVEEMGMQESLGNAWTMLRDGRLQESLTVLSSSFKGAVANGWYRANGQYAPYQFQAHAYIRFLERAVKLAFERGVARAREADLVAEAREAARAGLLLGHEYRATAIQDKDSGHCAHHALFNAISASVGFAYPLSVHRFVERARELLNVTAKQATGKSGRELAALEKDLKIKFGRDVGEGMGVESIEKWSLMLGMTFEARGPPAPTDQAWSSLLASGKEVMLSLRLFHERFPHSDEERLLHGHDFRPLHHEVYLLGAFDSPSRGVRLYMVQDSGTGLTEFFTAAELSAVTSDVQLVSAPTPRSLP